MQTVYIWGTGFVSEKLYQRFNHVFGTCGVKGYIDNDSSKWNTFFHGWHVYSPDILKTNPADGIFIAIEHQDDVIDQLFDELNYSGTILSICYFEKYSLIDRYKASEDTEVKDILKYLHNNDLANFNYEYTRKYSLDSIVVNYDSDVDLYYVMSTFGKVYMARRFRNERDVRTYYFSLMIEQDPSSPHRYTTEDFYVVDGSTVVDAGAAEGLFSLEYIDRASHVYMFEPDSQWCEALRCTFASFADKVTIIEKAVSDYSSKGVVKLDEILEGYTVDFIKMDIEGEEYYALKGAEKLINASKNMKCVVCTYHQEFAYEVIDSFLRRMGLTTEHSHGYMWFDERYNDNRPYVLRRGLIRAEK